MTAPWPLTATLASMTPFERWSVVLAALSVLGLPLLALVWRASRHWTRVEDKLDSLDKAVTDAAVSNTADHADMNDRITQLERDQLDYYRRARARARKRTARNVQRSRPTPE